jgi:hypothetical protein
VIMVNSCTSLRLDSVWSCYCCIASVRSLAPRSDHGVVDHRAVDHRPSITAIDHMTAEADTVTRQGVRLVTEQNSRTSVSAI